MPDKPANNRPQLNVRLDKHPGLLDEIKKAASDRKFFRWKKRRKLLV